jgi:hypothetical protein
MTGLLISLLDNFHNVISYLFLYNPRNRSRFHICKRLLLAVLLWCAVGTLPQSYHCLASNHLVTLLLVIALKKIREQNQTENREDIPNMDMDNKQKNKIILSSRISCSVWV